MSESRDDKIRTANMQRAFVMTVARAFGYMIDMMVKYCKENNIMIDAVERRYIINMRNTIAHLTSDYVSLRKSKSDAYKSYSKIMAVVIQQLFSKTDGDKWGMYKFYNYVKTFPTRCKEIEVGIDDEKDAFSSIFGNDADSNTDDNA